jgi:predicted TIM-barrel fold metal-dependent hydrolase
MPALPSPPFTDMHCHTAGIGAGGSGCFVSDALRHSFKFRHYLAAFGTCEAELERDGDAVVIDHLAAQLAESRYVGHAVVLALDGPVDARGELDRARTEIYVPNEFVAAQVARHPNLTFGASVNPYRPDALARLEWAKAHGAVLVKWLPSVQHIDPADPRLIPFYRKLVELHLPLLTHTGSEHSFTSAEDALCDPARLRLPLREGVTVIAAHAATTGRYDGEPAFARLTRLMVEFPNLYADISSLTQINKHGDLERVLRNPACAGRLIYGTDYPLVAMRLLVSPAYYPFRLSWADRRRIGAITNPWDRDVALKQALGVPADLWTRLDAVLASR